LTGLKKAVFSSLNMIRVYTRKDGIVSQKPLLLKRGVTVAELAGKIHRDFAEKMKYARVWRFRERGWGPSTFSRTET
jgi:ribosome-interacting GTPase 1